MKIVINNCHGGFGLSHKAIMRYLELKGVKFEHKKTKYTVWPDEYTVEGENFYDHNIPRNDPLLVQLVEEMGESINTAYSRLKVVDIPDDVEWEIDEYDGLEWVAEKHRTWS